MPPRRAAGLLLFRRRAGAVEVLLVHPGGPFWARKDDGAWTVPKGEIEPDEEPLAAARREVEEETGARPSGTFIPLEPIRQAGGKVVQMWAVESEFDPSQLRSNLFEMEWPPRSGRRQTFPEVDRAAWFPLETAARKILKSQAPLLNAFAKHIRANTAE